MKAYGMNILELIEYFMGEYRMTESQAEELAYMEILAANQIIELEAEELTYSEILAANQ